MMSSRALLLFLVGLNLIAFAWWSGALGVFSDSRREPQRLERQIEPDRLRMIAPGGAPATGNAGSVGAGAGLPGLDTAAQQIARAGAGSGQIDTIKQSTGLASGNDRRPDSTEGLAGSNDAADGVSSDGGRSTPGGAVDAGSAAPGGSLTEADSALPGDSADALARDAAGDSREPVDPAATDPGPMAAASPPVAASGSTGAVDGRADDGRVDSPRRQPADPPSAKAGGDTSDLVCVELPDMDFITARQWRDRFVSVVAQTRMRRLDNGRYLVFIDPLASATQAQALERELRAAGIVEARAIATGPLRNGLALASADRPEEAEDRRRDMVRSGVNDAQIGPVSLSSARYRLQLLAAPPVIAEPVKSIAARAQFQLETCTP